jgi:hypothetical protein
MNKSDQSVPVAGLIPLRPPTQPPPVAYRRGAALLAERIGRQKAGWVYGVRPYTVTVWRRGLGLPTLRKKKAAGGAAA